MFFMDALNKTILDVKPFDLKLFYLISFQVEVFPANDADGMSRSGRKMQHVVLYQNATYDL